MTYRRGILARLVARVSAVLSVVRLRRDIVRRRGPQQLFLSAHALLSLSALELSLRACFAVGGDGAFGEVIGAAAG